MDTRTTLLFKDSTVAKHMCPLHDNYVVVHVDKDPSSIFVVYKSH
jgi:hypothetical protein